MAMDEGGRRDTIVAALTGELDRQARGGSGVDVEALADAVEAALNPPPAADEGRHPDELNATNDD